MTHKMLIGLGVLVAASVSAGTSAFAAGAGASMRANMHIQANSLAETVALSPRGVRRSLRARGYRHIHFIDRRLPVYKVRACLNGKKFRLRLNRFGDVRRRVRIGWCDGRRNHAYGGPRVSGLTFKEIRRKLSNRGYGNIRFTDVRLPGYQARACKKGRRYTLWLNRWGKIMDYDRRGRCSRYGTNYGPRGGGYAGPRNGYYGPRNGYYGPRGGGPRIIYEGPGISITLGKNKNRY